MDICSAFLTSLCVALGRTMAFSFDNLHISESSISQCRQSVHTDWLLSFPKLDLSFSTKRFCPMFKGSFSSSKHANCCHYAFSLVLDIRTRNLQGHMPSHSGTGDFYPGANGSSPSLQKRLFWHSICLHVIPTNYSLSLFWLGIRRNDIWGFRFTFICKVKREQLNLFAFSTKILGNVVI